MMVESLKKHRMDVEPRFLNTAPDGVTIVKVYLVEDINKAVLAVKKEIGRCVFLKHLTKEQHKELLGILDEVFFGDDTNEGEVKR